MSYGTKPACKFSTRNAASKRNFCLQKRGWFHNNFLLCFLFLLVHMPPQNHTKSTCSLFCAVYFFPVTQNKKKITSFKLPHVCMSACSLLLQRLLLLLVQRIPPWTNRDEAIILWYRTSRFKRVIRKASWVSGA